MDCLKRKCLWHGVWVLALSCLGTMAQSRPSTEYEVKALFMYEFGRFVEWPANAEKHDGTFPICVIGEDPFGILLDEAIKNKSVSGSTVVARRILRGKDAESCRILFVSPSEDLHTVELLKALEGKGVLTVGEGKQFTRRGGMIGFNVEGNRVRFIVNLSATERAGLRMSSQLLKVASLVEDGGGGT